MNDFRRGLKQGLPIALGYIPVSFTFGLMAVSGGIPAGIAIIISMTNLTSAGQFAGAGLIIANASLLEITLTTFVINIRYMLMSLSLSQRIASIPFLKKCIMAFVITDEVFAVASMEEKDITFSYMAGLGAGPYLGWAVGTAMGALTNSILPETLRNSMGIALYAMFIAIIIPASKKSRAAFFVVLTAVLASSAFKWLPLLNRVSAGWAIIIVTVAASALGAILCPVKEEQL